MPGFVRSPGRTRVVAFFDDDRTQAILVAHLDLAGFGRRFGGAVNGLGSSARTLSSCSFDCEIDKSNKTNSAAKVRQAPNRALLIHSCGSFNTI
jgi:hypothetical protein